MNLRPHFSAACGLAAFLALCAPASANTFTFDLAGDTTTAYSVPPVLQYKWIDLHDATSGSTTLPGITLHAGDTVQTTVTLNHSMPFSILDFFLQAANDDSVTLTSDTTYTFSLGGAVVTEPGTWLHANSTDAGLAVGTGSGGPDLLSADKIIMNIAITSLTDKFGNTVASLELAPGQPYIGFFNPVASAPIPPTLWLMTTALGGLGIFARRRRKAAEAA